MPNPVHKFNLINIRHPTRRSGLLDMIAACLLFSMMNAGVYAVGIQDGSIPVTVISFVRILCNLLILAVPAVLAGNAAGLFGDRRPSLWLRGLFGGIALMLSFAAINRIGPGESSFLTSSNGLFIALLCPLVLGQRNSLLGWFAIIGSFSGVSLLFVPDNESHDFLGRTMALSSGLLTALAYLMVARAGRSNSPSSVIFYFCLVALIVHLIFFGIYGYCIPDQTEVWGLLLFTGITGSGAQYYMTRAYQVAPAALVAAVGYLQPVLSMGWGVALFNQIPSQTALLGSLLILLFGVLLPFLR